jgi:hypothetical protein
MSLLFNKPVSGAICVEHFRVCIYQGKLLNNRLDMEKVKLTGLNMGRVFNHGCGRASVQISTRTSSKQPNLKLKIRPKEV